MKKVVFNSRDTEKIISLYINDNLSLTKVGEKFGVSKNIVKRILIENKVDIRSKTTKFKQNSSIFRTIDSSEKAYWLGFIAADGCVYKNSENSGTLRIALHRKDREHLKKFSTFMGSNKVPINYVSNSGFGNNTPMSYISFYSTELVDDIVDKGVAQRKSNILKPPLIDMAFHRDFLMGYFDGDGSISKLKSGERSFALSILGTKEILEWAIGILGLEKSLIERSRGVNPEANNFYVRCGGNKKPYEALLNIYTKENRMYCLDRKLHIFLDMEKVVLGGNS